MRKFAESLYIFVAIPDELEKYVEMIQSSSPDNCICHNNITIIKKKLRLITKWVEKVWSSVNVSLRVWENKWS